MFPLPVELWKNIFDQMEGTNYLGGMTSSDWFPLLTTCRLFHPLVRENLYEDLWAFRNPDDVDDDDPETFENWRTLLLSKALAARPELGRLVRILKLHTELAEHDDDMAVDTCLTHPVLRQLSFFSGLRVLSLKGIYIEMDCHTAVRSLPRLESLEITACDIDPDLSKMSFPPISRHVMLALSLAYLRSEEGNIWMVMAPSGLRSLTVEHGSLEALYEDDMLQSMIAHDMCKTLTTLVWYLTYPVTERLCRFLESCAQIEDLSIPHHSPSSYSTCLETLSPRALPMLTTYSGPAEYAEIFVKGRPVHSVFLELWENTPVDVLRGLRFSGVPITTLALNLTEEREVSPLSAFEHAPTTLHTIHMDGHGKEDLRLWLPALSRMTNLQDVRLNDMDYTHSPEDAMKLIHAACATVRTIVFNSHAMRIGKWVRRGDGEWESYPKRGGFSAFS